MPTSIQKPPAGANHSGGVLTASAGAQGTPPAGDAETLYKQAIAAEKYNPQQAVTLYEQGANSDANPDRRLQVLNRANWLRENLKNPSQTLVPGVAPGDLRMAAAASESKVYPLAGNPTPNANVRLAAPQGSGTATNAWSGRQRL